MITLYLVVNMEEAMDINVEEAVDVEETVGEDKDEDVDVEGVMAYIVPHHQVVLHHTEDMPGIVGVGELLLE